MPQYLAPGVYVEETPPASAPIAGVGTSTAAFIGIIPDTLFEPPQSLINVLIGTGDGTTKEFDLTHFPVNTAVGQFQIRVNGEAVDATLSNNTNTKKSKVTLTDTDAPASGAEIKANYLWEPSFSVYEAGERKKCTSFSQFKESFGDLPFYDKTDRSGVTPANRHLIHAVYGFFDNGGSICHIIRFKDEAALKAGLRTALKKLETVDEIAIVAVPGVTDPVIQEAVISHCESMEDRFAVLDGKETVSEYSKDLIQGGLRDSSYGAIYFPWIKVFDPLSDEPVAVPPSGHVVGVYARVDGNRGVFKAPANAIIRGALDTEPRLSHNDQKELNPKGVNVIRIFNNNVKIWGARTMGGDDNKEFTYISTRRYFNFLRESIDEGTQFAVFEPNNQDLWQRITRDVSNFLLGQWRDGALFGTTSQDAFFVKCDEDTNPADIRERGQVVTLIGVAIVKPAEFVIFRIQQMAGN